MKPEHDHMSLTVGKLQRSVAFYERYFGLRPVRTDGVHKGERVEKMTGVKGGELRAAFVSDGDLTIELIEFSAARGKRSEALPANEVGAAHIAFVCEDVRLLFADGRRRVRDSFRRLTTACGGTRGRS